MDGQTGFPATSFVFVTLIQRLWISDLKPLTRSFFRSEPQPFIRTSPLIIHYFVILEKNFAKGDATRKYRKKERCYCFCLMKLS